MIPLIFFNCLITSSNFNINNNSQFFINQDINIEWNNLSIDPLYLFLTHNNPPIISKYSNHSIVLSKNVSSDGNSTIWIPPDVLNTYNTTNILWRFMITNTQSPHMGTINTNMHNQVFLSNYFYLNSDMNVSLDSYPYQTGYLDTNIHLELNNFDTFNISLYLKNTNNQNYLLDKSANNQVLTYPNDKCLILHNNSIVLNSTNFYNILDNISESQLFSNYNKIFVVVNTRRYGKVISKQSNIINLDYMYARLNFDTSDAILNNWCFKKIGSCKYDIFMNNTLTEQDEIYENITNVSTIFNHVDLLGNLIIYTKSNDLQSNTILNQYSTATTTLTTTPTSTVTTTPTSKVTTTSSLTIPESIITTLSPYIFTSTTLNYDPEFVSNQTHNNCSSCDDNTDSDDPNGYWIFVIIMLSICGLAILIAIGTYAYYTMKDECDDNQVYPSESIENTNTVSPNINVNVENPTPVSPNQDCEKSNSFYLVNRVLNNNIYTSSDNTRLYNNSLYSYSYTYPRNPVYSSPRLQPKTYTVNNHEYNILQPSYSYPSVASSSYDSDRPRYDVLAPRIQDN